MGANADTCVLTHGRSRTLHLSLKAVLTPEVKNEKKQSTTHTLSTGSKILHL